jgi:hypothetical protein
MSVIAKFIRTIVFIPIVLFATPALVLFSMSILLLETQEGTLRELFMLEVRAFGIGDGFARFMQKIFIPTYKFTIQGFVLAGAGFLVATVGLRSLGVLTTEWVYAALAVEFTLLQVWGIMTYYTPQEPTGEGLQSVQSEHLASGNQALVASMKELVKQVMLLESRLRTTEGKFDAFGPLNSSLQMMSQKLEAIAITETNLQSSKEVSERLASTIRELGTQLGMLEGRLKQTEGKMDQLIQIDTTLKVMSQKFDLLVGDQFNLRVRKEFEHMLAELGSRISTVTGTK